MMIKRTLPVVLMMALAACSADDVVSLPKTEATGEFWGVRTDIQAATVALNGTQQLVATPFSTDGTPMDGLPPLKFRSVDSTRVHVDQNGLVTGKTVTSGVNIIAYMTANGVTRADTTLVAVTAQRYAIKSFDLVRSNLDTIPTRVAVQGNVPIIALVQDSANVRVLGLAMAVYAIDPRILTVYSTSIVGKSLGKTKVVAMTTSYGRTFSDTVELGVIYATATFVYFGQNIFSPAAVVIGTDGTITWNNNFYLQLPANVIFDEPDKVPGGNIPLLNYQQTAARTFNNPGTYTYTNTMNGSKGSIVVREQPQY